jgi:hypothetical protein
MGLALIEVAMTAKRSAEVIMERMIAGDYY